MIHAKRPPRPRGRWLPLAVLSVGLLSLTTLGTMLMESRASADKLPVVSRPAPAAVPIETAKAYTGRWQYTGEHEGRKRVHAAINRATRSMDQLNREMARHTLHASYTPTPEDAVDIDVYRDTLDIDVPGCVRLVGAPLDEWVEWRCNNRDLRVMHWLSERALVQHAQGDELEIYRHFQVDGQRMIMSVKLEHALSPKPVFYSVRYTR